MESDAQPVSEEPTFEMTGPVAHAIIAISGLETTGKIVAHLREQVAGATLGQGSEMYLRRATAHVEDAVAEMKAALSELRSAMVAEMIERLRGDLAQEGV